jgi:hypothetical protein
MIDDTDAVALKEIYYRLGDINRWFENARSDDDGELEPMLLAEGLNKAFQSLIDAMTHVETLILSGPEEPDWKIPKD